MPQLHKTAASTCVLVDGGQSAMSSSIFITKCSEVKLGSHSRPLYFFGRSATSKMKVMSHIRHFVNLMIDGQGLGCLWFVVHQTRDLLTTDPPLPMPDASCANLVRSRLQSDWPLGARVVII